MKITLSRLPRRGAAPRRAAFTMMEIAICLAIIGFALVAIIGVLPYGMHTQRNNHDETIINADATMLLESIRSGARGLDDLTNYIYYVTNEWAEIKVDGTTNHGINVYNFTTASLSAPTLWPYAPAEPINSGSNIISVLSTPEYTDLNGLPISDTYNKDYFYNHLTARVRSMSGPAVEKPPQDNTLMREGTFTYQLICVNAATPVDTNIYRLPPDQLLNAQQLAANLRELRLRFDWPLRPNGSLGNGRQNFRVAIAGQLTTNLYNFGGSQTRLLYFYQPQSFIATP